MLAVTQRRTLQLPLLLRPRHRHLIRGETGVGEDRQEGEEGGAGEEGGEEEEGGGVEGEEGEGAAHTRVLEVEVQGKHIYSQYITVYTNIYLLPYSGNDWSEELADVSVNEFVQPVGPATIIPHTVVGMFRLIFTSALVGSIVHETNRYAHQVLGGEANTKWTDVTADDIWAFLGFALLMGINRLPQLHLYWNTNPAFHYLPIAERITRDRFMAIWRFLHFTPNSPSPSSTIGASSSSAGASSSSSDPTRTHDRLWKVRPVISAVVAACKSNYRPHREQAIDEAMVAFKGRSSMKQYLPMKPVKRGFKIWVRADSHNGYVCEFECYTGRKGDRTEVGLGGSVVTRLTRDLVGKSYHIFMDRFFSSVSLYCSLFLENIYCTGTLKSNRRDFPPDLKEVSKRGLAQRGDLMTRQDGNVGVCVWQDTRPVTFMSSGHHPGHTKSIPRKRIDGTVMNVNCPISIVDYNKYMGGVDRGDQYRKYYHVHVKSRKSYKYIFWFLFEVCVFNSYVLLFGI